MSDQFKVAGIYKSYDEAFKEYIRKTTKREVEYLYLGGGNE